MADARIARTRVRVKHVKPAGVRAMMGTAGGHAYEGAASGRRSASWWASGSGVNAIVTASAATLRNRSRQLMRNNPWAAHGRETFANECVGTGIRPRSMVGDAEIRAAFQDLFGLWVEEADADGVSNFYGQQEIAASSVMESGEVFGRLRFRRRGDGLSVPLQVQLLEADHVPLHLNRMERGGNVTRAGITFNALGQRVGYWMHKTHPGEPHMRFQGDDLVFVPADQVVHVFKPVRPGQCRGTPWLAPVLTKLFDLDGYEDAELMRKKIAAMFTVFLTQGAGGTAEDEVSPLGAGTQSKVDDDTLDVALEPGTVQLLDWGQKPEFAEPADVGGNYEAFLRWQLRSVAAGVGITYEQLTGDLTDVNYSSIRAGLLKFRRACRAKQQNLLVHQFCRPVYRAFAQQAVLSGAVGLSGAAATDPRVLRAKWVPEGWEWVDPLKEVMADQLEVRSGFDSRAAQVSRRGRDVEVVDEEIAADNARADTLGNVYDSDPRQTAKSGAMQKAEETAAGEAASSREAG